jgi:hypothetical protein
MSVASILATYPDVWSDSNLNAIIGTVSWVLAGLATAYFVLKWLMNSEKFYSALEGRASARMAAQREEERGTPAAGRSAR